MNQSSSLAVVILAAGQGTRMKSSTPKVLHELAGWPMLAHVLATSAELGAEHVIAVVRHERERVAAVVAERAPHAVVVDQDEHPGTGRAVEIALGALPDDYSGQVVVLSADVPLLDAATVTGLVDAHRTSRSTLTLLSAVLDDPSGFGRVLRDSTGAFRAIVEQKDASADELLVREVNAGVYVFDATALRSVLRGIGTDNAQGEKYLTDAASGIRDAGGAIDAVPVDDHWLVTGINDRVQLSAAARELNDRIVRRWQLAGVTVDDPATTWIDLAVKIEPDVHLLPGVQLKGATLIETGAVVGPDSTLVDCEVGRDATVRRTDATLAVIGAGATVGPFAFLRAGTVLGAGGKIGAFVETKNADIGAGSKVPHLSYIGDTTVGEGTNIGAGAITANYDDIVKHRTVIGSHVHSGAHNVFIAPITIGDGAKIGAGAIVRKEVPPGALAISVAPQRNMLGWVEKNRAGTAAADAVAAIQPDDGR